VVSVDNAGKGPLHYTGGYMIASLGRHGPDVPVEQSGNGELTFMLPGQTDVCKLYVCVDDGGGNASSPQRSGMSTAAPRPRIAIDLAYLTHGAGPARAAP